MNVRDLPAFAATSRNSRSRIASQEWAGPLVGMWGPKSKLVDNAEAPCPACEAWRIKHGGKRGQGQSL